MDEKQKKSLPLERIKRISGCSEETIKYSNNAALQQLLLHVKSSKKSTKKAATGFPTRKTKRPTQTIDDFVRECHSLASRYEDKNKGKKVKSKW
jgi:hypothetical protein